MGYLDGYRNTAAKQDDNEFSPGRFVFADTEALLPNSGERLALSGSTLAVNAMIDRCEAFNRQLDDRINPHGRRPRRAGRNQNLMAMHWLRMALVALVDMDRDCQARGATNHEHAEPIDEAWATERAPSSSEPADAVRQITEPEPTPDEMQAAAEPARAAATEIGPTSAESAAEQAKEPEPAATPG